MLTIAHGAGIDQAGIGRVRRPDAGPEVHHFHVADRRTGIGVADGIAADGGDLDAFGATGSGIGRTTDGVALAAENAQVIHCHIRDIEDRQWREVARHRAVGVKRDAAAVRRDAGENGAIAAAAVGADGDGLSRIDILRRAIARSGAVAGLLDGPHSIRTLLVSGRRG